MRVPTTASLYRPRTSEPEPKGQRPGGGKQGGGSASKKSKAGANRKTPRSGASKFTPFSDEAANVVAKAVAGFETPKQKKQGHRVAFHASEHRTGAVHMAPAAMPTPGAYALFLILCPHQL